MNRKAAVTFIAIYAIAAALGFFLSGNAGDETAAEQTASYILQGRSTKAVIEAVESVNGKVTHELAIINAVAATLTRPQRDRLLANPEILNISKDAPVQTASSVLGRDDLAQNPNDMMIGMEG